MSAPATQKIRQGTDEVKKYPSFDDQQLEYDYGRNCPKNTRWAVAVSGDACGITSRKAWTLT